MPPFGGMRPATGSSFFMSARSRASGGVECALSRSDPPSDPMSAQGQPLP